MLFPHLASLSLVLGTVGYLNASPLSEAGSAAPRALAKVPCTEPKSCDGHTIPCSTETAINAALQAHTPSVSVFWGGYYNGTSIRPKAEDCAEKYTSADAATIGMVLCQDPDIAMPQSGPLWDYASKRFAELAHGEGRAAIGEARYDSASYFNIELPALKLNAGVSAVVSMDVGNNCKEMCYWHCNGACPTSLPLCIIQTFPPNTPPSKHQ